MSRRANCWDNAVAESFFASLKKERIKKRIYNTRAMATIDVSDYIESFYNPQRRHSHLGGLTTPTVTQALRELGRLGIVRETTGRARGRVYAYVRYLEALNGESGAAGGEISRRKGSVAGSSASNFTSKKIRGPAGSHR